MNCTMDFVRCDGKGCTNEAHWHLSQDSDFRCDHCIELVRDADCYRDLDTLEFYVREKPTKLTWWEIEEHNPFCFG